MEYQFTINVQTQYQPEHSKPEQFEYAFTYTITIQNTGAHPAQLISRRWMITDGNGRIDEVRGLGVVGNQPYIKPGEQFEYTSWTKIATPTGSMSGSYFFVGDSDERFDAPIPEFSLSVPSSLH